MIVFPKSAFLILLIAMLLLSCSDSDNSIQEEQPQDVSNHRNIILIIIDTLRADHLSCYNYHRLTSPTIDSLAAAGTIWTNAQAQAPWTQPAHASIWTGLTVRSHRTNASLNWIQSDSTGKNYPLDENLPTIPLLLNEAGFSAPAIRPPTVAPGAARVRLSISATITEDEVSRLLESLKLKSPSR